MALGGLCPDQQTLTFQAMHGYHASIDEELYTLLHRFWELDEIPSTNASSLSSADQECENHFQATYSRDAQGRYVVGLPFK